MQIQNLMSGGRSEVAAQTAPVIPEYESNTCVHYERNCNIIAPCCDRIFGCRICHDEISPSGHANMNRFLIKQVVCKKCNTKQDARYVASMSPQISCLQTILPTFASFIVIFVFNVEQSLLNTIATLATSGWRVPKNLSIAMSAAFAALAASNPFDIAKSAACASQSMCSTLTAASRTNTRTTARCAAKICFPLVNLLRTCLVDMPFTLIVFAN